MNESAASIEPAVPDPVVPIRPSRRDPAATRQRWVDRVQRFRDSNLSVAQFCSAEGVSVPAFLCRAELWSRFFPNCRGMDLAA